MKKINILIINLLMFWSVLSVDQGISDTSSTPDWTLFAYIAADNSLADDASINIQDMQKGSNQYVNILGFLSTKKNDQKFSEKFTIINNNLVNQGITNNLDSGSVDTFTKALINAVQSTKSKYLMVDLWDHGSGILNPAKSKRGICFDDTTGNYLSDVDLVSSFSKALTLRNGKKINIIGFDACMMQSIEMASTLADFTDIIVASEETIPALGFNYTPILNSINNDTDPKSLASTIVATYKDLYTNSTTDFTLSAIDTSNVKLLAQNVDNVAVMLINLLNSTQSSDICDAITNALNNTLSFYEPIYIDLNDFYNNLLQSISTLTINPENQQAISDLNNALNAGTSLISQTVFSNIAGSTLARAGGLSIYFPQSQIDASYNNLIWTQNYPNWLNFLNIYLES